MSKLKVIFSDRIVTVNHYMPEICVDSCLIGMLAILSSVAFYTEHFLYGFLLLIGVVILSSALVFFLQKEMLLTRDALIMIAKAEHFRDTENVVKK